MSDVFDNLIVALCKFTTLANTGEVSCIKLIRVKELHLSWFSSGFTNWFLYFRVLKSQRFLSVQVEKRS